MLKHFNKIFMSLKYISMHNLKSIYLSIYLSQFLDINLSIYLSTLFISTHLFISMFPPLSIYLFLSKHIHQSIHLSSLSIYTFKSISNVFRSIYLSIHQVYLYLPTYRSQCFHIYQSIDRHSYIYIYIYIYIYTFTQPFCTSRTQHKVKYLGEFNRFELSLSNPRPVAIPTLKCTVAYYLLYGNIYIYIYIL